MPKSRRTPIDYTPQFGGEIFRPKEVVESELEAVESQQILAVDPVVEEQISSNVRTNERTFERPPERVRVRHSFDVWQDQLLSLVEIQTNIFSKTGKKPKLGELVQAALETYISKHKRRTNERSNERTYERTKR